MSNALLTVIAVMLHVLGHRNLRGGRYYIGAMKIAERMVVTAVNAEVL